MKEDIKKALKKRRKSKKNNEEQWDSEAAPNGYMSFLRFPGYSTFQSKAKAERHKLHVIENDFAVLICAEC
jgi:hypothetical protein